MKADQMYHSHLDFSLSAIHWVNNQNTFTIQRYDAGSGKLVLKREPWITDGDALPLSQRIMPNSETMMKDIMEYGKNPDEIDAEHPQYLHKCFVDVMSNIIVIICVVAQYGQPD
jgi:hypothetical protein